MSELTACQREAWRRFLTAHSRVVEGVEKDLAAESCPSLGDLEVLLVLRCSESQRLRMCELADRVSLSRSGLTRQVDRLERSGYLERATCPMDRRGTYASLLPSGLQAVERALPVYAEAIRERFLDPMGGALGGLARGLEGLLAEEGDGALRH